jgi:phage regulator Rha-like protein
VLRKDFLIQLTGDEAEASRSHFATLKKGRGYNVKYLPLAYTEHGAIMAAMVLNSPRAVQMSVYVVRAFVKLREVLASNKNLARRPRCRWDAHATPTRRCKWRHSNRLTML